MITAKPKHDVRYNQTAPYKPEEPSQLRSDEQTLTAPRGKRGYRAIKRVVIDI